jgi:hypothetical protein
MSQEETSCHKKKPHITRRNLQSREEMEIAENLSKYYEQYLERKQ